MRHKAVGSFVLPLGMFLFFAAPLSAQTAKKDMDNLRAAMKGLVDAYSAIDAERILPFYADDALYLLPDMEILKGKQAIKAYLDSYSGGKADFKQELVDLQIVGNLAYEVVNQVVTVEMKGQPTRTIPNKFIHLWRKQKDGSWRLQIDMVNSLPVKK